MLKKTHQNYTGNNISTSLCTPFDSFQIIYKIRKKTKKKSRDFCPNTTNSKTKSTKMVLEGGKKKKEEEVLSPYSQKGIKERPEMR